MTRMVQSQYAFTIAKHTYIPRKCEVGIKCLDSGRPAWMVESLVIDVANGCACYASLLVTNLRIN